MTISTLKALIRLLGPGFRVKDLPYPRGGERDGIPTVRRHQPIA